MPLAKRAHSTRAEEVTEPHAPSPLLHFLNSFIAHEIEGVKNKIEFNARIIYMSVMNRASF